MLVHGLSAWDICLEMIKMLEVMIPLDKVKKANQKEILITTKCEYEVNLIQQYHTFT